MVVSHDWVSREHLLVACRLRVDLLRYVCGAWFHWCAVHRLESVRGLQGYIFDELIQPLIVLATPSCTTSTAFFVWGLVLVVHDVTLVCPESFLTFSTSVAIYVVI